MVPFFVQAHRFVAIRPILCLGNRLGEAFWTHKPCHIGLRLPQRLSDVLLFRRKALLTRTRARQLGLHHRFRIYDGFSQLVQCLVRLGFCVQSGLKKRQYF
jgi:hypothetical protein